MEADPSDITTQEEFVRELGRLRAAAGLTIRQLAKDVDIPYGTIGGYFTGRHLPTPAQAAQFSLILQACGVRDPDTIQQWLDALLRVRRPLGRRPAASSDRGARSGGDIPHPNTLWL